MPLSFSFLFFLLRDRKTNAFCELLATRQNDSLADELQCDER